MSDDFIRGLEHDLVEAMERFERRRVRRPPARLPRTATLVRVAAAAAVLAVVLIAARDLTPAPSPARPHVVAVLAIGGSPMDAVLAEGSLWASDFGGSVIRVDPRNRRVTARIKVPGAPQPVTANAGSVWVQTAGGHCGGHLVRIDAGSGQIVARRPWPYPPEEPGALAAADRGVWIERGCDPLRGGVVDRLDPAGAVTARVALTTADGLATAAANLWVLGHDGTLTQIDAASGGIRQRWPGLAPLSDPNTWGTKALVADGAGVWVLSTGRAALLRVERGRIAQRITVDPSARPVLAKARDGLWIATADRLGSDNRLIRLNPHTRRPTATVKLGHQRPVALLPAGGEMYVVTSNGNVLVIGS